MFFSVITKNSNWDILTNWDILAGRFLGGWGVLRKANMEGETA